MIQPSANQGVVLLHGWDASARSWHGPTSFTPSPRPRRLVAARLASARGPFHFGRFRRSVPDVCAFEFLTAFYDLGHAALVLVHLDGFRGGLVSAVAVVPSARRAGLTEDFPLELIAAANLLGAPINRGADFALHQYLEDSLRQWPAATQVFAIETADLDPDLSIVLSAHVEDLTPAVVTWLSARDASAEDYDEPSVTLHASL